MKAITANELHVGNVLFLSAGGNWSGDFAEAVIFADDAFEEALASAQKEEAEGRLIGVYEIDVEQVGKGYQPTKLRERIRAEGPTVPYGEDMKLEGFYAA